MNTSYIDKQRIEHIVANIKQYRETILSSLVMLAEMPSPSGSEEARVQHLLSRFGEYDNTDCSVDEKGNVSAVLKGRTGVKNILLLAHLDTIFPFSTDHTTSATQDSISGVGLTDNSLGAATLAVLPFLMEKMEMEFDSNIILLGAVKALGRANISGTQFFLDNVNTTIHQGICIEGYPIGRLSYSSIGMLRAELEYSIPEEFDWMRFGAAGAIVNINEVLNRILEIPIPSRPRTSFVFNHIESGAAFNVIPSKALLQFEIRSESDAMVDNLAETVQGIIAEVSSRSGAHINLNIISRRRTGGLRFDHSLVRTTGNVLRMLDITPRVSPSTSDLAAFITHNIPAVTIGLTTCTGYNQTIEKMEIAPLYKGIAQLLYVLEMIDKGHCDE